MSYSERVDDPRIDDSPWLFKMSPEGVLLWEKVYYDFDSTLASNGSSRIGALYDFIELGDGSILAVGNLKYNLKSSMLVMRVDSNGCLDPNDCQEIIVMDILTNTHSSSFENKSLLLYPIPTTDVLHIKFESGSYNLDVRIMDMFGRITGHGRLVNGEGTISTGQIPDGMYMIQIFQHDKMVSTSKFLKIGI
jgi:hypothetical protein